MAVLVRTTAPTNQTKSAYEDVAYPNAKHFEAANGYLWLYDQNGGKIIAIFHPDGWLHACFADAPS